VRLPGALKRGDAAAISAQMMPQVELHSMVRTTISLKLTPKKRWQRFFKDHPVTGFTFKHQGTSKLDDQYRIGDMTTQKGSFRVTFFMKKSGQCHANTPTQNRSSGIKAVASIQIVFFQQTFSQ
jgi:hypothetical protein